ncbi:TPA: hypothetical protein VCZ98_001454 [Streptococcus pyogenes]|nr:hypothetical protein [Streptococcus pyogenes]
MMIWNVINTLLALGSLLAALYSIIYAHRYNRYVVNIEEAYYSTVADHLPRLYQFDVFNNSMRGIFITDIQLFDGLGDSIPHNPKFQPEIGREIIKQEESTNIDFPFGGTRKIILAPESSLPIAYEQQNPHRRPVIVPAGQALTFTYYLDIEYTDIKIKVTSDKKLKWFSKSQSFNVKFDEFD